MTHDIQDDRSAPGLLLAALSRCVLLIVVFLVCMPAGARSETIVSHGATPAGNALSLIANRRATPGLLSDQIVEAAEKYWSYPLMPRLVVVLEAYSRDGEKEAEKVLEAFAIAGQKATTEAGRSLIANALASLKSGLPAGGGLASPRSSWFQHDPQISLDVPITQLSLGEWPMPVFHDRLSSLLEQHLNKTDRRLYVREAFQAFLATDCESFMQGKVATTCQDIGLFRVQYQALRLALAGLSSDGRDPDVADVYLSQSAETLLAVLERAEPIYPGGFYRQCSILRKWLLKPPSRWEVWSDLEPGLQ